MQNQINKQKQEADEDQEPMNVNKDGFTAQELGEASAYDSTTDMMQQMQNQNPADSSPQLADDDRLKQPKRQSAESDLSKKR